MAFPNAQIGFGCRWDMLCCGMLTLRSPTGGYPFPQPKWNKNAHKPSGLMTVENDFTNCVFPCMFCGAALSGL